MACSTQVKPLLHSLPPPAYAALPYVLAPVVGNPVLMALARVSGGTQTQDFPEALRTALLGMLPMLGKLADVLPKDTLLWKLEMLRSGCEFMDRRYGEVCFSLCAAMLILEHHLYSDM